MPDRVVHRLRQWVAVTDSFRVCGKHLAWEHERRGPKLVNSLESKLAGERGGPMLAIVPDHIRKILKHLVTPQMTLLIL